MLRIFKRHMHRGNACVILYSIAEGDTNKQIYAEYYGKVHEPYCKKRFVVLTLKKVVTGLP